MQEDKVMVVLPSDFIILGVKSATQGNKFTLSNIYMVRQAAGNNGFGSLLDVEDPSSLKLDKMKGVMEIHDLNVIFINHINGTPLAAYVK